MKFLLPNRTQLTFGAITALFLLGIGAAAARLIWWEHEGVRQQTENQVLRFTDGAVTAVNRTLLDLDLWLASLQHNIAPNTGSAAFDRTQTEQSLRAIVRHTLLLRRLVVLDADANLLASSDQSTSVQLTLPLGFVAHAMQPEGAKLFISAPVLDALNLEPVLYLARHFRRADGSKVLALAEVALSQLNNLVVQSADIDGLEVTLERSNGQLLSSVPALTDWPTKPLMPALDQGSSAVQEMPARLSGKPALLVAQPLLFDDALVVTSIDLDVALTHWRVERNFIALMALLVGLMVLLVAGFASWHLRRLGQARKALADAKAEVEKLAFYDHLTQLPNRLLLLERLTRALLNQARQQRYGGVLFIDLDNFKTLNDTLGHDVGDQLLQEVASRLQACVRTQDTVARLGGDEFVILLADLAPQSGEAAELTRRIAEKLLSALNRPYHFGTQVHKSSASVGAALFGAQPVLPAEVLKQADIAMYQAKASGRNALCFFDPQMQAAISAHAALEADLQTALEQEQFVLYYQPQLNHLGTVLGAEVLIRWQHPQRGMVPPLEFIAVAEESELINQIGLWALHNACLQLRRWQLAAATASMHLAVNVSARQFRQTDFVAQVHQVMLDTGISPNGLKLELTESLVLANVPDTIAKMNALKQLGVRFSMDDFGTGQSSLSYLTQLPLDQLKIDQSFVRNLGIKPNDAVIVQTIIGMAGNLGLEVIAEGVETAAQQAFLAANGCHLYQGYLYGQPTPVAQFMALLAAHASAASDARST